jgi:hypothetical protein
MESNLVEIRIKGENAKVPSACIDGRTVIVTGKLVRRAAVMDEQLVEGPIFAESGPFIEALKQTDLKADIFTFEQRPPDVSLKYDYHYEWDNWAAIPITTFSDWMANRLSQDSRRNVRVAKKRGVVLKPVSFDDELVRGIQNIYNETPVRQGRPFWHFGKDFEEVKRENATYLDRSEFVGAYFNEELIGFIKIIYVGPVAMLIQILSMNKHHDKRPTNALVADAVALCERRGISLLAYGKYVYDKNKSSSLTEFKRRNGFEEIQFPRYFVPLTAKGELMIKSGLHRGWKSVIPDPMLSLVLNMRSRFYRGWNKARQLSGKTNGLVKED